MAGRYPLWDPRPGLAIVDHLAAFTAESFGGAIREHVEFGSQVAMQNSNAETDDQLHPLREVPRWSWAGG